LRTEFVRFTPEVFRARAKKLKTQSTFGGSGEDRCGESFVVVHNVTLCRSTSSKCLCLAMSIASLLSEARSTSRSLPHFLERVEASSTPFALVAELNSTADSPSSVRLTNYAPVADNDAFPNSGAGADATGTGPRPSRTGSDQVHSGRNPLRMFRDECRRKARGFLKVARRRKRCWRPNTNTTGISPPNRAHAGR